MELTEYRYDPCSLDGTVILRTNSDEMKQIMHMRNNSHSRFLTIPLYRKDMLPKKYIINHGATILFWEDGTKTVVKRCKDDEFNKRLGFLTAFFQYATGMSKSKANKFLHELEVEDEAITTETKEKSFKVGDKVRIRKDLTSWNKYGANSFVESMEEYKGKEATIVEHIGTDYRLDIDKKHWGWTEEMFEKISNRPKHMKGENNG